MKHLKRYIGLITAAAMIFSLAVQAIAPSASAAAKPKLSAKSVKIEVGKSKKVKVKNAKGYNLSVKSKKKAIATAKKKGSAAFVVKAVKKGKTTVVATLKKGTKKVTLKCKVTVKAANDAKPADGSQANQNPANPSGGDQANNQNGNGGQQAATPEPTVGPFPEPDKDYLAPYGYDENKDFVTLGTEESLDYNGGTVKVQLPADYSADKKYPVLYLLNDDFNNWDDMSADHILANVMALKRANKMIVVKLAYSTEEDFVKVFTDDIIPAVENKYSVATGRVNRAVAGCDEGGTVALRIGISAPDKVAYIGAFVPVSGAVSNSNEPGAFHESEFKIPGEYSDQSLIMIQNAWKDDYTPTAPGNYYQALTKNDTDCIYFTTAKNIGAEVYKIGLYNFARRVFKRGTDDEGISNEFVDSLNVVPTNFNNISHRGKIETLNYETETYDEGNSVPMTKHCNVYLPYGYDPDKQYNIFYLMHGGGENAETWLVGDKETNPNGYGDYTHNQDMVNYLMETGYCEPCIIVNPTFYRPDGIPTPENARDLTVLFWQELRKDLIPAVEAKYHTYADFDTSEESLQASRMHRAFAGLSMGSNTTYESAYYRNYDIFAWFGPLSGIFRDPDQYDDETERFLNIIDEGEENGMPLGFFYSGNGTDDFVMAAQYAIMERALMRSDKLVAGRNFDFVMIWGGEHNMWSWHVHLYNMLKVFFTRE